MILALRYLGHQAGLLTLVVVGLLVVLPHPLAAQFKIDLKTPLDEKGELTVVKQGVLAAIEDASWVRETDFGEKYSLWLHGLERDIEQDTMVIVLKVNLRTPAMVRRGRHLDARRIEFRYDWDKARAYAADSIDGAAFAERGGLNEQALAEGIGGFLDFVVYSATLVPGSGRLAAEVFSGLARELNRDPTPVEVMEALYMGQAVLGALDEMVRDQ